MTCDQLSRFLALYTVLCAMQPSSIVQGAQEFGQKVSVLLNEEPENPKCFAEGRNDLTCFWEEDEERAGPVDQYTFTYKYQNENSSRCPLRTVHAAGGKRLYFCHLNRTQMFVQMDIQIHREGILIHSRNFLIELLFFLDAPTNLTVSRMAKQGQLNVSWVPPPLKYMDDSMMYEVIYAREDSHVGQVEVVRATPALMLRGLQPSTKYKVQVRVKLDGISYNGFWSVWSEPVFMETLHAELNPLIVSLTLIISFILILLSLIVLMSHRRFLIKKIWPTIPTPDSKFQGLFTLYGGNFEEWLGQTNGGLWLSQTFLYPEECATSLEVLSELSRGTPLASPPLPPKLSSDICNNKMEATDISNCLHEREQLNGGESALTERWRGTPNDCWLMDRLRELHRHSGPCFQSSLLESQDAYVMLSGNNPAKEEHLDDILEESLPLEMIFASRKPVLSESHSDLGSVQQSSGSGHLSSQSSFEQPHHGWIPSGPGYTYMAVADSGVSVDYSPMSRTDDIAKFVIYANEIPAHRKPFLLRQHPVQEHF